ncbi:hypothetical protein [Terrimonas pollutisoli]|uniref:hypothetical protein n=1 Tax=Terrimonas pollutisoli TaxID=3034147 RepID=UPI0023EAF4F1|nr:hypothetical protein [Terrimonas sp. H1YJ31]
MKKTLLVSTVALIALSSCKDQTKSAYYDLNTGKSVDLVKDEKTGRLVDAETKEPVYIYVNKETNDTILGSTGQVINGHVIEADGKYTYAEVKVDKDGEYKIKEGDYKEKMEKDGDLKIKEGDSKTKVDGETGEVKHK